MQTSRQSSASDFVYLLHAAAQQPLPPEPLVAESEDEENEDPDEDEILKEINFDD